jgi:hypothetical protein
MKILLRAFVWHGLEFENEPPGQPGAREQPRHARKPDTLTLDRRAEPRNTQHLLDKSASVRTVRRALAATHTTLNCCSGMGSVWSKTVGMQDAPEDHGAGVVHTQLRRSVERTPLELCTYITTKLIKRW